MKPGKPKSGMRPRMGGGFNQGMGQFGEHLDEAAMSQASQQKAISQQAADPQTAQALAQAAKQQSGSMPQQPREVGGIFEEVVARPSKDVVKQVKSFFDINTLLNVNPQTDTPEEQAKKRQVHQKFNQLTQEQQQVAKQKYQEEMQKEKQREEEEMRKKQLEQQQKAQQNISPPSSPKKGPVGPGGSGKKRAVAKLEQDRKSLSGPGSVG